MKEKTCAEAIIKYDPKQQYQVQFTHRDHKYVSPSQPLIQAFFKKIESNTSLATMGVRCVLKEQQIKKTWILGRVIAHHARIILEGPSYATITDYLPTPVDAKKTDENLDHLLQQLHATITPLNRKKASFHFQTKQLKECDEALFVHFEKALTPYIRREEGEENISLQQLCYKYDHGVPLYWPLQTGEGAVDIECGKFTRYNNRFFITSINEPLDFLLSLRTSLLDPQKQHVGTFDVSESFYERFELQTNVTREYIHEKLIKEQQEKLKNIKK